MLATMLLAACSGGETAPDADTPSSGAAIVDMPSLAASDDDEARIVPASATSSPSPSGRAVRQESDYYEFDYAFPEAADASPVLRKWFENEIATTRDRHIALARKDRDAALAALRPFRRYSSITRWQALADTPGFMSLSAFIYTYQGGPHGVITFRSFVWDKRAVARRPTLTLFRGARALSKAIRPAFCAELDRLRADKHGKPVDPHGTGVAERCPEVAQGNLVLRSGDKVHFDKLGVILAPAKAGPDSEGTYDVRLPVTAAVIAAVRPRFRKAFAIAPAISPNASESPM